MKNSTWGAQLPFINWESISEQHQPIKDSVTLSNPETGHLSEKLGYHNYNDTDDHTMTIRGDDNRHNLVGDNEADTDSSREPHNNHVESFRLPTSTATRSRSVKCDCRDMNSKECDHHE